MTDERKLAITPEAADKKRFDQSQKYKLLLRICVFELQKDWNRVLDEGTKAMNLKLDEESMQEIWPAMEHAQEQLDKKSKAPNPAN